MNINQEDLLMEFYSRYNNPDIKYQTFKEVCQGPWLHLKNEMENDNLCEVRFKYFGTFKVYPGRAKSMLERLKNTCDTFAKKEYDRIENMLIKFITTNESKSKS